jgi:beta-glucosidase
MEYDIISAGTTYQYFSGNVLWPFGHGLSYSSFEYSQLKIDKTAAGEKDSVTVSFRLKNKGAIKAEEVPQLYVTVTGSIFRRPLKTLKGFDRISLAAGEEKIVSFEMAVNDLAVWDSYQNCFRVEAGYCSVLIGASSSDIRLSGGFAINGENLLPRKISAPIYAEQFDDYTDCFLHEKRGSSNCAASCAAVFNNASYCDKTNVGSFCGGNSGNCRYDAGCCEGGWIRFAALDFGEGISRCSAIVQGVTGSRVEIRLDSPDGALVGVIDVPNTGETCAYELDPYSPRRRPVWAYAETNMEKICGIHDLYLVLYGKTGIWRFELS